MRFAVISDVHFGSQPNYCAPPRILSQQSEDCLISVLAEIRKDRSVEFLVQLGDLIQDSPSRPSAHEDYRSYLRMSRLLASCPFPVFHAVGNHDVANLSPACLSAVWGRPYPFYAVEMENFHFFFLNTSGESREDIEIEPDQLSWLRQRMAHSTKPFLVFSHHPLANVDLSQSHWFRGNERYCLTSNRAEVCKALEARGGVVAYFHGHTHQEGTTIQSGLPHFSCPSVSEDLDNCGNAEAGYLLVDVTSQGAQVEVRYAPRLRFQEAA